MRDARKLEQWLLGDPLRSRALEVLQRYEPHAWLAAGAIRGLVWAHQAGCKPPIPEDFDVLVWRRDTEVLQGSLEGALPLDPYGSRWSVKDQARMHLRNRHSPYADIEDAMRFWPETATAVAARRCGQRLEFLAPYGLADLMDGRLVRSPRADRDVFEARLRSKGWLEQYPHLQTKRRRPEP